MTQWELIDTAPKDGSPVWVRRIYRRRIVKEGWAVFGVCHPNAPQREPLGPDPLGRGEPYDRERDLVQTAESANQPKWLTPDRMFSFPSPTHWRPGGPPAI